MDFKPESHPLIRSALSTTLDALLADPSRERWSPAGRGKWIRRRSDLNRNRRLAHFGRRDMIQSTAGPVRFFWVVFVPTSPEMASVFLVNRPSLRLWLARDLASLEARAQAGREALTRALDLAREAARDHCRSALDRALAMARLDALLSLVATLAVEALNLILAIPPPRVASAGGRTGLHTPLN